MWERIATFTEHISQKWGCTQIKSYVKTLSISQNMILWHEIENTTRVHLRTHTILQFLYCKYLWYFTRLARSTLQLPYIKKVYMASIDITLIQVLGVSVRGDVVYLCDGRARIIAQLSIESSFRSEIIASLVLQVVSVGVWWRREQLLDDFRNRACCVLRSWRGSINVLLNLSRGPVKTSHELMPERSLWALGVRELFG